MAKQMQQYKVIVTFIEVIMSFYESEVMIFFLDKKYLTKPSIQQCVFNVPWNWIKMSIVENM